MTTQQTATPATRTVTVHVTADDIRQGDPHDGLRTPVALALTREWAGPNEVVYVHLSGWCCRIDRANCADDGLIRQAVCRALRVSLPPEAATFERLFHAHGPVGVGPITFEMERNA